MTQLSEMTWYVLQCPPGAEFRIGGELRKLGLRYLIPCSKQRVRVKQGGMQRVKNLPLYPKYVFLAVAGHAPWAQIKAIEPAPVIPVQFDESGPAKLSARDVDHIHNPVVIPMNADPEAIREGVLARIVSGPFMGFQSSVKLIRNGRAALETPRGTMTVPVAQLEVAA